MSINSGFPDYELPDRLVVTDPAQLKAMSHPLRTMVLDLLLERAATVTELAAALARPKSTVAHHVGVLVDAGLLRVVWTRKVRAIDERFYGRTARVVAVGALNPDAVGPLPWTNALTDAAQESAAAHEHDTMRAVRRHARIGEERAAEFWSRIEELVTEFTQLPRSGEVVHGIVVGLYPTDHPSLPDPTDPSD